MHDGLGPKTASPRPSLQPAVFAASLYHQHINMFKLDWLHIMDLGVAADVAGNVLWLLQGKMPGANVKTRVSQLYLQIAKYYKETGVQDKLNID